MYKVYEVDSAVCYHGMSLVAAENAIEANKIIDDFIKRDENNVYDSHGYCHVSESDCIEPFHSDVKGIVRYGIYYGGAY